MVCAGSQLGTGGGRARCGTRRIRGTASQQPLSPPPATEGLQRGGLRVCDKGIGEAGVSTRKKADNEREMEGFA